jgi:hypothetical protein
MFYLVQFDDIDSKETKRLQHDLSGQPNGTILSYACYIRVTNLPKDKWIVWIEKDNVYEYNRQYEQFLTIKGIKSFIELDIPKSPRDNDWLWEDDYVDNIFAEFI